MRTPHAQPPNLDAVVRAQRREIELLRAQVAALDAAAPSSSSGSPLPAPRLGEARHAANEEDLLAYDARVKGLTTAEDVRNVRNMCVEVCGEGGWRDAMRAFYAGVVKADSERPAVLRDRDERLEEDWYMQPWYLLYVQYTGTVGGSDDDDDDDAEGGGEGRETGNTGANRKDSKLAPGTANSVQEQNSIAAPGTDASPNATSARKRVRPKNPRPRTRSNSGTFDTLVEMLPYIADVGFRNLCLLPHYESPLGDGGYDISAYSARASLGGEPALKRFMDAATAQGFRVATDAVFNHTSTEHPWFQAALAGDDRYIAYYVQRNGREKIAEFDRDGDIVCRYRDPDGAVTERVCVFPDIDRTHGLWAEISGKTYQFYREFYPFQVDLNLQNPQVLAELFTILAKESNDGVLGKRMDAIAHWIKRPATTSEGLPECHALQALLKSFLRHICQHAIVIPEIVRNFETVADYAGVLTAVNGVPCPSEGDALMAFEMQAALRETTYFQTVAPFWQRIFRTPRLPPGAAWVNLLEHHDETYMGFFAPEVRHWIREYIKSRGGVVFKNGMSAGGRYSDCLDQDPARIATAIFVLYMSPGIPLVYAGLEIGRGHNIKHANDSMIQAHATFQKLGVHVSEKLCYDPRELQRGPIPRSAFIFASDSNYLPWATLSKLNDLRQRRPSLRSTDVHPIDSSDIGVLCMARQADPDVPLLCVANLTPFVKDVAMPVWQVRQRLKLENNDPCAVLNLTDLVSGEHLAVSRDDTSFRFSLASFDRRIYCHQAL
jgi:maltose alpha-D-glucosyltransferase / alpha-amylase